MQKIGEYLNMEDAKSYELFMFNRLLTAVEQINKKYKIALSLLSQRNVLNYFNKNIMFDCELQYNQEVLFYIEFKKQVRDSYKEKIKKNIEYSLLIVTEKKVISIIDGETTENNIEDFEKIIVKKIRKDIEKNIKTMIFQIYDILKKKIIKSQINNFEFNSEDINFDYDTLSFKFAPQLTNNFFNQLLKDGESIICRYTTQDSIFSTLKYKTQRMFGIAGMNDIEEVDYTDKYIYKDVYHSTGSNNYNNTFILSCSSDKNKDNLTMYRLYADDAKGVCLRFAVDKNNIDSNFYLKKVEYADENGINKTLDLIREMVKEIQITTLHIFDFFGNSGWKYFFKPKEYSIENEVRLLYIGKKESDISKDWVITNGNGIINPFIDFSYVSKIKKIPLSLIEIILGPKHPEKELNVKQYIDFLDTRKDAFSSVNVEKSKIQNYR